MVEGFSRLALSSAEHEQLAIGVDVPVVLLVAFKVLEFEYYDAFRSSELNWHLKILSRLLCAVNKNSALRFSFIAQKIARE